MVLELNLGRVVFTTVFSLPIPPTCASLCSFCQAICRHTPQSIELSLSTPNKEKVGKKSEEKNKQKKEEKGSRIEKSSNPRTGLYVWNCLREPVPHRLSRGFKKFFHGKLQTITTTTTIYPVCSYQVGSWEGRATHSLPLPKRQRGCLQQTLAYKVSYQFQKRKNTRC